MTLPLVFSAASLLLCGFFFIYFRNFLKRQGGREGGSAYRDEVEETRKLIADIDAATERDLTLIEDRLKTLREVLDAADRRVAVLVRELDRTYPAVQGRPAALYTDLGKALPKPAAAPQPGAAPQPAVAPVPAAPQSAAVPRPAAPEPAVPDAFAPEQAKAAEAGNLSIGEKAAELAEAGFSPELIAARLGVSVTEVDLAVTIYRRGIP
ncbi:MAG: hypothetical protein LBG42_00905 [Treponema sp.]|jgi:uncharacterized membrane protein|nr:hypothetical protein [Treponema sp.]